MRKLKAVLATGLMALVLSASIGQAYADTDVACGPYNVTSTADQISDGIGVAAIVGSVLMLIGSALADLGAAL